MTGRVTAMALRHRDMASGLTPLSPTLKTNFVYLQHEEGIWKMADGYCQVYGYGSCIIFYLWRLRGKVDNICWRFFSYISNSLCRSLAC